MKHTMIIPIMFMLFIIGCEDDTSTADDLDVNVDLGGVIHRHVKHIHLIGLQGQIFYAVLYNVIFVRSETIKWPGM